MHCREATLPCAKALAKLFKDLRAGAQRRRGRAIPGEIKFSCEDRKLTAGKPCPPHVPQLSSSRSTYFCYHLLLRCPKSGARGQLLWMGDSYQNDKCSAFISPEARPLPLHQPNTEVHSNPISFIYTHCCTLYSWQLVLMT